MEGRMADSRRKKGPRKLGVGGRGEPYAWYREGRIGTDGVERGGLWVVIHKRRQVLSTGLGLGEGAERKANEARVLAILQDYKDSLAIQAVDAVVLDKGRPAHEVSLATVLSRYLEAKRGTLDPKTGQYVGGVSRHHELAQRVVALLEWWGERTLADVDTVSCAAYVASRVGQPWKTHARLGTGKDGKPARTGYSKPTQQRTVKPAGVRRELEDLRAAVNVALADNLTRDVVRVVLPPKGEERDRWLERSEAARLILRAWRKREIQKITSGPRKGETYLTPRRPARHLARFILVALRTGTRSGPICNASFVKTPGLPWMELTTETTMVERVETRTIDGEAFERRVQVPTIKRVAIFHRKAVGTKEAENKKAPTVRMPDSLVAHLWRWHHVLGQTFVVEWQGKPIGSTKKSFANLVYEEGLGDDVVRHSLRHTAVTWGMQAGVPIWELAGYVGMGVEMIERRYGHHSAKHMEGAREALGRRGGKKKVA
jgi:integrase